MALPKVDDDRKVHKVRITNPSETGLAMFSRVFLDDREITASVDRVVIDIYDGLTTVTLRFPGIHVEYDGHAAVDGLAKVEV